MYRENNSFVESNRATDTDIQLAEIETASLQHPYENLGNRDLPIHARKQEIIDAMVNNQVVIVISPTGTGKSTQIPQYALEAGFTVSQNTQPRRPAATNVAARVQEELGEVLGEEKASEIVSCHTGGGLNGAYDSALRIMTEGVLRHRDTYDPTDGTDELWILDEVHEGSNEMWLLAGIAKKRLAQNPDFTVVVMTATANKYDTINYWTSAEGIEPAVIELEGSTNFPIEHREEPESTTAREAVKAAIDIFENPDEHEGANTIQVFEDGVPSINDTIDSILRGLPAAVKEKCIVLPNYSRLTPEARKPVYEDFDGIKIVVQTNIGKTSMTIPRTRYVISSGVEKMIVLDEEDGVRGLEKVPSSVDCIIQEKGRAGRTSSGIFILTRHAGEDFIPMDERPEHLQPEILRSIIDGVIMGLAVRGENIRDFDGNPRIPEAMLNRSMQRLQAVGALDDREQITKLGKRMARYPASPECQRSLVEAEQYGVQVRLAMAAMVAATEVGGLRLFKAGSTSWEQFTDETSSDMFAQLDTFIKIKRRRINEEAKEDLDTNNITSAEELYRKIAHRSGIDDIPPLKVPSVKDRQILRECIVRGFAQSAYLPAGDQLFRALGGATRLREISNRSVVSRTTRNAVVGRPFDIQVKRDGALERKPIIETVTEVPVRELGKYAVDLTRWQHVGYSLRGGKFVAIEDQVLGRQTISRREVPAHPSPVLRDTVIQHVKAKPGEHLRELYKIKSETERLARRSRTPIARLTQDAIDAMIAQAAPADVNSPDHVEENLRQMIVEQGISLDTYVPAEQREKIMLDAPDSIEVDGYQLKLQYVGGKPIVRKVTEDVILGLQQQPVLPDGRSVLFMYDDKRYTWYQVRQRLVGVDGYHN